ncbi:MAG: uracil phosphoribosyltransferase [Bdellovibrio sp. CG12_big_fil_rev_8_21_14_0_65_39_13]|nr:MAG: uracil phosphoribosyltransferase [Bdellovibrio sp. CG22_combo_CG10-13_8_21_14_all_39_27]PIQ58131.1 MAG: uracil phosphoribosyltransferase [Bdellovibrio sp. CG12_big_fil_rev_8_21_14_0_65_39_13]PIR34293.1 MAG: uracil phosphoribosyltransferase [Bdellovibrio sp. CG11_big_fil_rev_8_21_14_0_20_39_38]
MTGKRIHIDHPLLRHKLGYLRDKDTQSNEFRELMKEISRILAYEVMRDWKDFDVVDIETPIAKTKIERIVNPPIVVSILRAGNGMLDAVLSMIPFAQVGFIGIYRDKFIHNTVEYYFKMPKNLKDRQIVLCDPLLATGDTLIAAIDRLKSYEVGKIKVLSVLASSYGLDRIHHFHPDVDFYFLNEEKDLNEKGYLVPGLGDAGDRLFQTL